MAEALVLEAAGAEAVVASGFEAGGHRGSFLRSAEESLIGTFALIPQVVDRVRVPVIAAGGIADSRGVAAAQLLGADGVQVGTAFLACRQSNATPEHRAKLFSPEAADTLLSNVFTGRLARAVRNRLSDERADCAHELPLYPLRYLFLKSMLLKIPASAHSAFLPFWAGQWAVLLQHYEAADLFRALMIGLR